MDYQIPSCIPACETNICWTGVNNIRRYIYDHEKRLKLRWTCIIMEMRRRWTLKILRCTMDGSKVYRVAAKDRKKKRHANKTWKRQKQDMQKMKRNGKHELHSTLDVQRKLWVHVWIGCCIANGYSHSNKQACNSKLQKILAYRKFCVFLFGPHYVAC